MNKQTKSVEELIPGDWISTPQYASCVFLGLDKGCVNLRYQATRVHDQKEIWVNIIEEKDKISYESPADSLSLSVIELTGVYGEIETSKSSSNKNKNKP